MKERWSIFSPLLIASNISLSQYSPLNSFSCIILSMPSPGLFIYIYEYRPSFFGNSGLFFLFLVAFLSSSTLSCVIKRQSLIMYVCFSPSMLLTEYLEPHSRSFNSEIVYSWICRYLTILDQSGTKTRPKCAIVRPTTHLAQGLLIKLYFFKIQ